MKGLPSQKLTWKPEKGPMKTTVPLKRRYMGVHVSLGASVLRLGCRVSGWIDKVSDVGRIRRNARICRLHCSKECVEPPFTVTLKSPRPLDGCQQAMEERILILGPIPSPMTYEL